MKRDDKKLDDLFSRVLDGEGMQSTGDVEDMSLWERTDTTIDPASVDSPAGAMGPAFKDVSRSAWEKLTGETELPDWYDELVTIGELARHAGVSRDEVKAALDEARPWSMSFTQPDVTAERREFPLVAAPAWSDAATADPISDLESMLELIESESVSPPRGRPVRPPAQQRPVPGNRTQRRGQADRPGHVSPNIPTGRLRRSGGRYA